MSDDYAQLAPFYDTLGMSAFAETLTPQIIAYAHSHDWMGRRIVDLGCGTGVSVGWLANRGYNVTGIDTSLAMLKIAQQSINNSGISYQLFEGDIRALSNLHEIDMVLALDVLNELNSLRDLETVFASVARVLAPDKLFLFDLHTIEGLAQRTGGLIADKDDLNVFVTHRFDYDRQVSADDYIIFQRGDSTWQRQRITRTVRGFPVQVVTALLQRAGFGIMALLNTRLETLDPATMREPRVLLFARRSHSETE